MTLAGLLMFGKDQAIRDPNGAPNYSVDYREKLDPELRWADHLSRRNVGSESVSVLQQGLDKFGVRTPTPFQLEGAMRRDVTPAHEALREAFVNAIIHGDSAGPGCCG